MKQTNELMTYLSDNNIQVDELGRVVIEDPAVLAEINGALSSGDAFSNSLFNGGCSNGACG